MNAWSDRFEQHTATATLRGVREAVERMLSEERTEPEAMSCLLRVQQVIAHLDRRLSSADPQLVTVGMLETLQSRLAPLLESLTAFQQDASVERRHSVDNRTDSVLDAMHLLTGILVAEDAGDLREAIVSLRRSVGQHIRQAGEEVARLTDAVAQTKARADALSNEIASREGRLEEALSRANDQHTAAQASRANEFLEFQKARLTEWQELERQRATEFEQNRENRAQMWAAEIEKLKAEVSQTSSQMETELGETIGSLTERIKNFEIETAANAKRVLDALDENRSKAEQLVGIMSRQGLVHGYRNVADEAGRQRKVWLLVAASSLGGLIVTALLFQPVVLTRLGLESGEPSWQAFSTRIFLSLTFVALAAFAGNQANRLETTERRNRQTELELAALGPFLQDLEEKERNAIISRMAEKMFGKDSVSAALGRDVQLPAEAGIEIVKQALTVLGKKA